MIVNLTYAIQFVSGAAVHSHVENTIKFKMLQNLHKLATTHQKTLQHHGH